MPGKPLGTTVWAGFHGSGGSDDAKRNMIGDA